MLSACEKCPHRKTVHHKKFPTVRWEICGNQCGEFARNGAHPLSPCVLYECEDDEDAICRTDEIYIIEGNRCAHYCSWLMRMRAEEERTSDPERVLENP